MKLAWWIKNPWRALVMACRSWKARIERRLGYMRIEIHKNSIAQERERHRRELASLSEPLSQYLSSRIDVGFSRIPDTRILEIHTSFHEHIFFPFSQYMQASVRDDFFRFLAERCAHEVRRQLLSMDFGTVQRRIDMRERSRPW